MNFYYEICVTKKLYLLIEFTTLIFVVDKKFCLSLHLCKRLS